MLTRAQASTAKYAASRKMIGRAADAAKAATWRIYQYTRSQAVADGFQIKITKTAGETSTRLLTMAVIILVTTGSRAAYPPPAQNQTSTSG